MQTNEVEITRSQMSKELFEKRRREGYEKWLKKKHKEMERRKEKEEEDKERRRIEREEERLRKKSEPKKKIGRPKKRGPKKKRKSRAKKHYKERKVWDYKIISFHNGRQVDYIGKYYESQQAYDKIRELLKESNEVVFPKMVDNNEILEESRYEYLILEKNRYGDKVSLEQRNQYGRMVKQTINSDKWVIMDKFPYDVEETFWVWGFNPNTERKTFRWIYENIITYGIETKYDLKRVFLYKNKIIVKDDNNEIDLIFCKTQGDSIRFYNKIDEWNKKTKNKQVFLMGSLNLPGERKRKIEDEIMELTGWNRAKVQQSFTKKHSRG